MFFFQPNRICYNTFGSANFVLFLFLSIKLFQKCELKRYNNKKFNFNFNFNFYFWFKMFRTLFSFEWLHRIGQMTFFCNEKSQPNSILPLIRIKINFPFLSSFFVFQVFYFQTGNLFIPNNNIHLNYFNICFFISFII